MRRISVACECLAGILENPLPEEGPIVDVRIQDWLNTDEPQECLCTLSRMESLLQQDTSSWIPRFVRRGRGSTATQDKIKEAVDLFSSYKGCFHFLFSTKIWNNERAVQKRQDATHSRDHIIQGEFDLLEPGCPMPAETEINIAVPLDPGVHQGGYVEHVNRESNVVVQHSLAPVQADLHTTVPKAVNYRGRQAVTQRRHELKTDKQREEEEKKHEEGLKWLDGLNCAEKQDVTLLLRQEDTCKWLFDTAQYKMWKDGESGSLWLRGKPGAGKSVLAYVYILYVPMALKLLAGPLSSIPSGRLCETEKFLYFFTAIFETSGPQALRK
ncbi:hypothetical protein OG21DRAFT_1236805 [Imleria badia]|nr:hypothetical protein OG21DRAFT_1236805 [Imleria badia]